MDRLHGFSTGSPCKPYAAPANLAQAFGICRDFVPEDGEYQFWRGVQNASRIERPVCEAIHSHLHNQARWPRRDIPTVSGSTGSKRVNDYTSEEPVSNR